MLEVRTYDSPPPPPSTPPAAVARADRARRELVVQTLDEATAEAQADPACGADGERCCLHELIIDFRAVGWTFILAPRIFSAGACAGRCDLPVGSSRTRASIATTRRLQTADRMNAHSNLTSLRAGRYFDCCHSAASRPLTIAYLNEFGTIFIRDIPDLVATHCTCT